MSFLKKLGLYHLLPFTIALTLLFLFQGKIFDWYSQFSKSPKEFSSKNLDDLPRHVVNYADSVWAELAVAQSLSNKNGVTIFGSSELQSSSGVCYNFLKDSLGVDAMGIGHAHNESFAIYCQLLNFLPYLENANVSIILSPGWFEGNGGTNSQAFLEFVPSNFIANIYNNKEVKELDLSYISNTYVRDYDGEISGNKFEYSFLYAYHRFPMLKKYRSSLDRRFSLNLAKGNDKREFNKVNWDEWLKKSKSDILPCLNEMYVDTGYYNKYLIENDGSEKKARPTKVSVKNNIELEDLKMIMKLLKDKNCNASFVIQPLNPYYYSDLEIFTPLLDSIESLAEKNNFALYNLFTAKKNAYEPGVLRDVMHLSDYGWIKVNKFIYEQHFN